VHVLSMSGGAWNFGASIMSFLFPMILFVLTASTLYVLYTKPEVVPGHALGGAERPVSYTAIPRLPEASAMAAAPVAAGSGAPATAVEERPADAADAPATAEDRVADTGTAGSTDGEAPGTGDGA
jgi:hypothetical protein